MSWLWLECGVLFVALPLALAMVGFGPWMFLILLGAAFAAGWWLHAHRLAGERLFWAGDEPSAERRQVRRLLVRFLICAPLLTGTVAIFWADRFLFLPRERPLLWLLILLLYPILSVYPQELLYRAFFFRRYGRLFPAKIGVIVASVLLFSWLHLLFRNPVAVSLTLVGGWFFAETYARTRSLRLVCLEHLLYGNLIFTIGLGKFFFHG